MPPQDAPPPRQYWRAEVERTASKEQALLVIDNVVYDVTAWLDEHPGGMEVLLDNAGKDASQCFHDVGHSEDAKEWMKRYVVGEVVPAERRPLVRRGTRAPTTGAEPLTAGALVRVAWPPLAMAALAFYLYSWLFA